MMEAWRLEYSEEARTDIRLAAIAAGANRGHLIDFLLFRPEIKERTEADFLRGHGL